MSKVNSYAIPVSIIVAAFVVGGFYYLSEIRKQRHIDEVRQSESEKAAFLLSNCTGRVKEAFIEKWYDACSSLSLLPKECLNIRVMPLKEYAKLNNVYPDSPDTQLKWADYVIEVLAKREKCSCRLPTSIADRLNGLEKEAREECYRKYPQK